MQRQSVAWPHDLRKTKNQTRNVFIFKSIYPYRSVSLHWSMYDFHSATAVMLEDTGRKHHQITTTKHNNAQIDTKPNVIHNYFPSSSSNFIPNRIQQYNTVCMTSITNSRVIIDFVMWFCWWPPEKPWAYQAGSLIMHCLAGGKWLLHGIKHSKDNQSQSLRHVCRLSLVMLKIYTI